MNTLRILGVLAILVFWGATPASAGLSVSLTPAPGNPDTPRMGDRLSFQTSIRNTGTMPEHGLVAWISLLQTDPGKEQPVDLEDWSAHKAVTAATLEPGQTVNATWPMRLIAAGHYRLVVCLASRETRELVTSPVAAFTVRGKPVVASARVLPVALGIPLLLGGVLVWRWRRSR
ncbi:conserved hypothetical protein [Solidesulfovibrio fructosivorans JJ]]|uniref:CARDB domain-containing protein n=1 Tax=Solidesulfovibrio fructosivorans JJ] TaxID=596151 RepID=E1JWW3_SOLFR|nr:hypothetical protein [Solidesulfovibrio fructosivorans]EFL51167.1 conserved hypothetical protein [Solidesulfovibrio fructosivorans JJ]]